MTIGGIIFVNRNTCNVIFFLGKFSLAKAYPAKVPITKHKIVTPLAMIELFMIPLLKAIIFVSVDVKISLYLSKVGFWGIICIGAERSSLLVDILEIMVHKKGARVKNRIIIIKTYRKTLLLLYLILIFIIPAFN
jgi:hypothetical protein